MPEGDAESTEMNGHGPVAGSTPAPRFVRGTVRPEVASPPTEAAGLIIETTISPFHCLYQDALWFHQESRLKHVQSEAEASRLARGALLLYLQSAEALVHQAVSELGRPELVHLAADPLHPLPLADVWILLPTIATDGPENGFNPELPPWPQFEELLKLETTWRFPGAAEHRRAYYRAPYPNASYEPLQPHQVPLGLNITSEMLCFPRTGLPRDPYAMRPKHLDTVRGILDAAIESLDRRLGGALTAEGRHRREPVRVVYPPGA